MAEQVRDVARRQAAQQWDSAERVGACGVAVADQSLRAGGRFRPVPASLSFPIRLFAEGEELPSCTQFLVDGFHDPERGQVVARAFGE
ncbi:hypothetical protein ADK67_06280 [Saccharothrix sp. NRRL B-16348]|nr:hypothetical protein ADK67_06280 [Saccharothrix sp. NRRL B-16348]